ncbi:zona pellucida sperm-binding protein 3-like [Narcine bancroftii]|uniref:zona pellucida sperm-binding protein 3-like n=1 Tax=Narcine bancroftii TaxID=1343680 RepID=UPI0038316321
MTAVARFLLLAVAAVTGQQPAALPPALTYSCGHSTMTVWVAMDPGAGASASALRLGKCPPSGFSSPRLVLFQYALQDCWAGRLVTDQEVIFWNYLKFGGSSAPGMDSPQLNARLECRYPVNERPILLPSLPLTGALAADGNLIFSMKMMTGDWTAERPDSLFFLGASINLEASVLATYHQPLRLYLKECIATPTRSLAKSPENYTIINNYGLNLFLFFRCLVDGKTGNSKYLPRSDGSILRFVIQAFKFLSLEDADIFIHCSAFVWVPSWDGLLHKACSFDQQTKSWKLLDAPLQSSLCDCCNTSCQPIPSRHKQHTVHESSVGQVIKVGPLRVLGKQLESKTLENQ